MGLSVDDVAVVLRGVGYEADDIVDLGAGAWSSCYGFVAGGRDLVVRFGRHVGDFEKDRFAVRFSRNAMPIPLVELIRPSGDGFLAVSTRARGAPLESVDSSTWERLVPSIADLLEALRTAVLPVGGFGGWVGDGIAIAASWRDHLLDLGPGTDDRRPRNWYQRLGDRPTARTVFDDGYRRLASLDLSDAPRSLIHADLVNRNVHVTGDRVTGVFDWGCGRYGDHLYDDAWFEFWAPFHPQLDVDALLTEVRRRRVGAGADLGGTEQRREACLLHIGLDHIVYHAAGSAWSDVDDVIARLRDLRIV